MPITIYQNVLDILSRAALDGNVSTCRRFIGLPFRTDTLNGTQVIVTEADLVGYVLPFTAWLRARGVTDYIRLASGARRTGDGAIEGTHVTHALRNGQRVFEPYASRMLLRHDRATGDWRVSHAAHAIANARFPIRIPEVTALSATPPEPCTEP